MLAQDDDDEDDMEVLNICQVEELEMRGDSMTCKLVDKGSVNQVVQQQGEWVHLGSGEITIDSAADESCWPIHEGGAFEIRSSKRNILLKAANGQAMRHLGEKDVTFNDKMSGEVLGMTFQVTEVKKPLAAVWRLVGKGNLVQFGPRRRNVLSRICNLENVSNSTNAAAHTYSRWSM